MWEKIKAKASDRPHHPPDHSLSAPWSPRWVRIVGPKFLQRRIAIQSYRFNAKALIHRLLPPEVMIEILLHSVEPKAWSVERLRQLASVSRYWRDLILGTPAFWSILDSTSSSKEWEVVLARNLNMSLEIQITAFGEPPDEFIALAATVASRCSSLYIAFTYQAAPRLIAFLSTPLPLLKDIFISNHSNNPHLRVDIGDGVHLRHIGLYHATLRWDSPRLNNLESLRLHSPAGECATISQLYSILASSSRLRYLYIFDWYRGSRRTENASVEEFQPVQLPFLTSIVLESNPDLITSFFVSHIRAPNCRTLAIDPCKCEGAADAVFELARPVLSNAKRVTTRTYKSEPMYIGLESSPRPLLRGLWGDRGDLGTDTAGANIQLYNVNVDQVLRRLPEMVGSDTELIVSPPLGYIRSNQMALIGM